MSDPFADEEDGIAPPLSRAEMLQRQKQEAMNRQLDTTQRCMASIWDSEAVGIATAEELARQGEQLNNIEQKTEKINADTKTAQFHINGIKSVFGGIKNWWNGEGKKDATPVVKAESNSRSETFAALKQDRPSGETGMHPALRLRTDDASNPFYDDDVQTFDSRFESGYGGGRSQTNNQSRGAGTSQANQQSSSRSSEWNQYEAALDKNLDCMSGGLSQLKLLATGLNAEIVAQNDQVDRIMPKVDRADTKIRDQNRQMRQILGKDNSTAK